MKKKGLKITGIVLAIVLLAMIITPFLFKGKIKEAVIATANKQLNAKLDVKDFGLNLFSNFPNATLSLENLSLSGIGDFENDTLVKAKSGSVAINLSSLFSDNYEITKIVLDNASIHAKLLADGRANWEIMKDTTTSESDTPFNISLDKISLKDCNIIYEDQVSNMKAVIENWTGSISGDFSASETTLKTQSTIEKLSFIMDGIPYIKDVKAIADATLKAEFDKMKFTFIESKLQLNEVKASIDGSVAMVGEEGMDFDLKLNAPNTEFKDILSLMPAMYTEDFKNIKTAGTASLDATVKGLMEGEKYPAFNLKLLVKDAMFQYPSLPKAVNNINIDLLVDNKGGSLDNTVIDINKFSFNMGGNPFNASLNIKTPISDANLKASMNGILDLAMIKDVYPLEKGTQLNGKLTAAMSLAARMSAIEKEQYQNVSASGNLKLANMVYKSEGMSDIMIDNAGLEFSPQFVNLSSLNVKIGKNDIAATGRLENFIAYALKGQTLKGQLNVNSNYFNLNDFMGGETAATDTSSVGVIEIPKNIDFNLAAAFKHVVYEKINITNMNGAITVKNGTIALKDVGANALGGSCKVNGSYSTAENPKKPKVDFALSLSKVSFAETFKSVEMAQKIAPIFDKVIGNYSMNLNFKTSMGDNILQMLSGLTGSGSLQTNEVKIEGVEALTKLSSALKTDALKSFSAKDLNIPFSIADGKVITKPFNFGIGDGGKMNLSGTTGLDQTIDYKGTITLPKSMANNLISNVGITIGGTFTSPKIGVDTKSLIDNIAGNLLGGKGETATEAIGSKITDERIKQAQNIREKAQSTSDKLVQEAEKQAEKLVEASSNPLAKIAAKKAGDKLVQEAKKQGQKLIDEANTQATKLEGASE